MDSNNINRKIVPPGNHRRNVAERQICTFKNHFISILAGTEPDFPLHIWYKLILQACITINLLQNYHRNPQLSAEAHLNGKFDYNKTTLAPPRTKVVSFEPPDKCSSWSTHVTPGWYIGLALQHYRCWKIHIAKTSATRVCDTVEFFPKKYKMPTLSSARTAARVTLKLSKALKHPHPTQSFVPLNDNTLIALKELSAILSDATTKTTALLTSANPSTIELPRVREPPPRVESRKAVKYTRVEEVQDNIITPIQMECWGVKQAHTYTQHNSSHYQCKQSL